MLHTSLFTSLLYSMQYIAATVHEPQYTRMMALQQVNRLETNRNGTYEIQEQKETQKYNV